MWQLIVLLVLLFEAMTVQHEVKKSEDSIKFNFSLSKQK